MLGKAEREDLIKVLKEDISFYEKDREKQINRISKFEHLLPEGIRFIEHLKKSLEATEEIIKSGRILLNELEVELRNL